MATIQQKMAELHADAKALQQKVLQREGSQTEWSAAAEEITKRARALVPELDGLSEKEQEPLIEQAESVQRALIYVRGMASSEPESLMDQVRAVNRRAYELAVAWIDQSMLRAAVKDEAAEQEAKIAGLMSKAKGTPHASDANRLLSDARLELTFVQMDGKAPVSTRVAQYQRDH